MRKIHFILILMLLLPGFACKKNNPAPVAMPYASFTIKGVNHTYHSYSKFSKDLCVSSTYCGQFYYDSDNQELNNIKIGIPGDPIVGHIYKSGDYRFDVFYLNETGVRYDLTVSPMQVVFSVWEGQGGWGKGTFSGWLRSSNNDSIEITNGYFQGKFWTTFQ